MEKLAIKIYRGTKKQGKTPGRDLQEYFRIEPPNSLILEQLVELYPTAEIDQNQSLLTRYLHVYFTASDIEKILNRNFVKYNNNRFVYACDSDRQISTNIKDETRPCQAKGMEAKDLCPQGCRRVARLNFWIKELVDNFGDYSLAGIDITSIYEWFWLPEKLQALKDEYSSLSVTDLTSESGYIPFIITRENTSINRKRGEQTNKSSFYAVKISIEPNWYQQYKQYLQYLALPQNLQIVSLEQKMFDFQGNFTLMALKEASNKVLSPSVDSVIHDVHMTSNSQNEEMEILDVEVQP